MLGFLEQPNIKIWSNVVFDEVREGAWANKFAASDFPKATKDKLTIPSE